MKDLCISPSRAGDAGCVSLCRETSMGSGHIGHPPAPRAHDRVGRAHPTTRIVSDSQRCTWARGPIRV